MNIFSGGRGRERAGDGTRGERRHGELARRDERRSAAHFADRRAHAHDRRRAPGRAPAVVAAVSRLDLGPAATADNARRSPRSSWSCPMCSSTSCASSSNARARASERRASEATTAGAAAATRRARGRTRRADQAEARESSSAGREYRTREPRRWISYWRAPVDPAWSGCAAGAHKNRSLRPDAAGLTRWWRARAQMALCCRRRVGPREDRLLRDPRRGRARALRAVRVLEGAAAAGRTWRVRGRTPRHPPALVARIRAHARSRGAQVARDTIHTNRVTPRARRGRSPPTTAQLNSFPNARFGVTPAVLHVVGAQLVVEALRASLSPPPCEKHRLCTHDGGACEANSAAPTNSSSVECGDEAKAGAWFQAWLMGFGQRAWWSEYTLYRLALDMCARARARARARCAFPGELITRSSKWRASPGIERSTLCTRCRRCRSSATRFGCRTAAMDAAAYSSGCVFTVQSTAARRPPRWRVRSRRTRVPALRTRGPGAARALRRLSRHRRAGVGESAHKNGARALCTRTGRPLSCPTIAWPLGIRDHTRDWDCPCVIRCVRIRGLGLVEAPERKQDGRDERQDHVVFSAAVLEMKATCKMSCGMSSR